MKQLKNFLIKREQSQTRLSFAECEKSRLIAKLSLTLLLLITAAAGAWADDTDPVVTIDNTKTQPTASFTMPANDVTVNYTLVRDMNYATNPVTFDGIPTGDGLIVKKGSDGKYKFGTDPTFKLTDPLAAEDDKNIIAATGLTVTVEKKDNNEWPAGNKTITDFLADAQPGTYRLKAMPTDENSPYDGTVYSSEFTVVEQYDLTVKPADEYSKDKLDKVIVGSGTEATEITPDANTGEATKTGIAPITEVKIKATRGYIIEKVEVKKKGAELPKYADVVTICEKNGDNKYLISSFFNGTNANITTITKEEAIALAEYLGGGDIRVVYEEYESDSYRYVRATNAAGNVTGLSLSTTNFSNVPLYYVPAGN